MTYHIPEDLFYTDQHEWIKIEDDHALVGITDFAQSSLGDIVFVELPEINSKFQAGEPFGVVESIKSVSDLYCPLSGDIVEINKNLENRPELCNSAPYDSWMIKIKMTAKDEISELIPAKEYENHCKDN